MSATPSSPPRLGWWSLDLIDGLRYGSAMPYRFVLAMAASLYAIFTAIAPATEHLPPNTTSFVLITGWRWGWVLVFATDALAVWWRIFDRTPRLVWAWGTNIATCSLWCGITIATIQNAPVVWPGLSCHIVVAMISCLTLFRTEATVRDRVSA